MPNKEKKVLIRRTAEVLLMAMTIVVFFMVLSAAHIHPEEKQAGTVSALSEGWYYFDDGERVDVTLPAVIPSKNNAPLVLYNESLSEEDAGKTVTLRGAQYGLTISMNGDVIYRYKDGRFPRNTQMKSKQDCDALISTETEVGRLELSFQSPIRGKYEIPQVWIGSGDAVMIQHIKDISLIFAVAVVFVILAIIGMGTAVYLRFCGIESRRFVDAALFLILCSIWFVTDSSIMQTYGGSASVICTISFYAFMLFSIPMLFLVRNTGNMKKYRLLDILIAAFFGNVIVQSILHLTRGIEFVDMLFATHLLLTAGVISIMVLMTRESRVTKDRDVKMVLAAFITVGTSGILALLLYWIFEIPYYGNIFQCGILLFVLIILANIIISMAENIHYRTEMQTYQRMLKEDWMTGLGSRQPFEEYLSELQKKTDENVNPALIYLDVNQLKKINDTFGHAAGDQAIIDAAKCITKVFGAFGGCYRIGGDEFGVILPNPEGTPEEWFERLDQEMLQYNRNGRYPLSIAHGWSYLRGEDGRNKTLSDWKYEADCKMYENKGRLKRV